MGQKNLGVILNSSLSLTLYTWWARKSFWFYLQTLTPTHSPPATTLIPATSSISHLDCCHWPLLLSWHPCILLSAQQAALSSQNINSMLLETQPLFLILTQKKIQSPNHDPEVSAWSILPSSSFALSFLTLLQTQRPRRTLVLSVLLARDALLLEILQAAFLSSFRLLSKWHLWCLAWSPYLFFLFFIFSIYP